MDYPFRARFSKAAADAWAATRPSPSIVAPLGDSRISAVYLDAASARRNYGARSPLNMANALLGQRLVIGQIWGRSGWRTDQLLALLPEAIASGAGTLYIQCGVNNIAQAIGNGSYTHAVSGETVTGAQSGAAAFADIAVMIDAGRKAGMAVVVEAETGGGDMNTSDRVAQVNELNTRLYDHAERTPGVHLHDARPFVLDPLNSETALSYRAGYAYDVIHTAGLGAYHWGKSLAGVLERIAPPRRVLLANVAEAPGNGRRQLLRNPLFATASGGTLAGGATGIVPQYWTGRVMQGTAGAAFSTAASADGIGNDVVIDATFSAAGEEIRLQQDVLAANWSADDVVELVAEIEIAEGVDCLASVNGYLGHNDGTATFDNYSLIQGASSERGVDEAAVLTLRTRLYTISATAGSNPYVTAHVRLRACAAGAARVKVRQIGVKRA